MPITLEEATEATDIALAHCIKEVNEDPNYNQRQRDQLIDTMLETRQKSIDTLMKMTPNEELNLRRFQVGTIVVINNNL